MVQEPNPNDQNSPNSSLRDTVDSITSLISVSYTIRVFSVKWQLIRKRLEDLSSFVIALENTQYDQMIVEVVSLVSRTVDECHDLASRCISVSYNGKLLMQSELDKVISKLDLVQSKFLDMYQNDGVISGGLDLIVSRPPGGATREDMKFYVKDLLNRLKIGDCQMKRETLVSLNEVIVEDEKYVKIVVELGDFVLTLVSFLDSKDSIIREEAAMVVAVIAAFDSYKGVLVISGVIAQLVRVLENGSLKAKKYSMLSLMRLTENGDNAWAFSAHSGVSVLLNLCSREYEKPELIGLACWVLRNVVVVEEIKRFMIDEGAICTFIKLVNGSDEMCQIGSIEFLQSLAFGDECIRHLVVKEGMARALVQVLDPKLTLSFKLRETALRAIENLCFCDLDCVNLLISYGFLDQLMYFLQNGDFSIQELAFKSASRLCSTSEEARKSMGDKGFMAEFVKFLEAKSYNIREMAAEALCRMIMVPKNRKKFSNDDHNIGVILQLIDPNEGNCGNSKLLLSILLSLINCNHTRRIISHSKFIKNIEKLAEVGVPDAKKIMRKLSTNKFKSMWNVILHSKESKML